MTEPTDSKERSASHGGASIQAPSLSNKKKRLLQFLLKVFVFLGQITVVAATTMVGALILIAILEQSQASVSIGPVAYVETHMPPVVSPPPPTPPVIHNPTYSIYFSNGSAALGSGETNFLDALAEALDECPSVAIEVYGSHSSVPYLYDPGGVKNRVLANDRATIVANYLHQRNLALKIPTVQADKPMKRYRDARVDPRTPKPTELLNRRADIVLADAPCNPPIPNSK